VCGCQEQLHTDEVITPTEVVRWAQAHAEETGHTLVLLGEVRTPKATLNGKGTTRDHQR
jgi:hypothetical protein